MLTPQQYEEWPVVLVELIQRLEEFVLTDIARRIRKEVRVTSTAGIQMASLLEYGAGVDRIKAEIMRITGLADAQVDALFEQAARESASFDTSVYQKIGLSPVPYEENERLQRIVSAQAQQTKNEFRNFTGSMGFAYRQNGKIVFKPVATAYQDALDSVQIQMQSGAVSPDTAIRGAVKRLTDSGLRTVDYASGVSSKIDVAVRRATVTGMSQISGYIAEEQMRELDTDLVEVSAHGGARDTGSGFENHKQWQGKVYSFSGKSAKYPSLREKTGYGNVAGLKGANCRHDFHPFVEGASRRQWTDQQLRGIDRPPISYRGKQYSIYQATQRQRAIEAHMRNLKLNLMMFEETGLDKDYQNTAVLLQRWRQEYKSFSRAAGMREQTERARVYGFGTSQAARARAAANRAQK